MLHEISSIDVANSRYKPDIQHMQKVTLINIVIGEKIWTNYDNGFHRKSNYFVEKCMMFEKWRLIL